MAERKPFPIPVKPAVAQPDPAELEASSCASGEPYALMVLGDSMLPEFEEGEIIVIEPSGLAKDGSYVIAQANGELIFRQLKKLDDGWLLKPVNPGYPSIAIDSLEVVTGVVILKKKPGRRRAMKEYT